MRFVGDWKGGTDGRAASAGKSRAGLAGGASAAVSGDEWGGRARLGRLSDAVADDDGPAHRAGAHDAVDLRAGRRPLSGGRLTRWGAGAPAVVSESAGAAERRGAGKGRPLPRAGAARERCGKASAMAEDGRRLPAVRRVPDAHDAGDSGGDSGARVARALELVARRVCRLS